MLNWAEREAGQLGQTPLPGLADTPTLAERARRWHAGFGAVACDEAPSRPLDALALADALLAREHGGGFTAVAWQQARANIALAETRNVKWIDSLPWRLGTAAQLEEPGWGSELEELDCNLDYHNSALRAWTTKLAWMVRPWLKRETALPWLSRRRGQYTLRCRYGVGPRRHAFRFRGGLPLRRGELAARGLPEQYTHQVALLKSHGLTTAQASCGKPKPPAGASSQTRHSLSLVVAPFVSPCRSCTKNNSLFGVATLKQTPMSKGQLLLIGLCKLVLPNS
jgi:hypothetical protein